MPKATRKRGQASPIKDMGASKRKTRQIADRTLGGAVRKPARQSVTGQGGSAKGRQASGEAGTGHISERGGVKADSAVLARRGRERKGKVVGGSTPGSGLTKAPSRAVAGPVGAGGRTRTGRDRKQGARGPARSGSRTRSR
jgi:hypothetical protein